MLSLIRRNPLCISLLAMALLASVKAASAEPVTRPKDPTVWQRLDPSKPEHAAILEWHRALISNDYDAYIRIAGRMRKTFFDNMRKATPPTIMIAAEPHHVNPNGSKDYHVAGCMQVPGDPRGEVRMVAGVTPIQEDGKWRVLDTGFDRPWNNLRKL